MSLIGTAVRRPVGTVMITLGVLVVGLVAARELAVDLLPSVDFPRISVVTLYEGVGPEEIETLITRPIEQSVSTIEGIEQIESTSAEGISRIQLQFGWGTDLDVAVNDTRAAIDRLAAALPEQADRPVVYKFDLSSVPIALLGLTGGGDPRHLRYLAEETLSRRLERVEGVASVSVRGGRLREIRVELDASLLVSLGVSAAEVSAALARDNANVSAGDVRESGREVLVRTVGQWETPSDIRDVVVARRDGRAIRVRDVGVVLDTVRELNAEQWVDGRRGITLQLSKQSGANTVEVVDRVREAVAAINADHGGRLTLTMLWDSSGFIRRSVSNVQSGALIGAGLAVVVLLVFLRSLRSTAVLAVAIPLSVVAALGLMYFAGYTLNVISFGGLALGIGMLVDNGIVILESIHRKREEGLPVERAATEGAGEVAAAVVSGTLTTVVVFAPVVFLGGFASVFFGEMAAVVTFALLCSLAIAVTLVPSIAAMLLRRASGPPRGVLGAASRAVGRAFEAVEGAYARLVGAALRAPWFVLGLSAVLLAASVRLVPEVGFELIPDTDEGQIDVDIDLPVGTPIEQTIPFVEDLERRVVSVIRPGELDNVLTTAGPENWWRTEGGNVGEVQVDLVPVSERERGINAIMKEVRQALAGIPDARFRIKQGNANFLMRIMRGGQDERLVVEVRGHDRQTGRALADQVATAMAAVPGVAAAYVEEEEGQKERAVRVDPVRAADLGLERADVAAAVETYVLGRVVTRYRERGNEYDVRVQLRPEDRHDVGQLERLPLLLPTGGSVPLTAVADVRPRQTPQAINRDGQERVIRVLASVGDRPLGDIVADLEVALRTLVVPEDFTLVIGGEHAEQTETFEGLVIGLLLALFLVYTVMAVVFESLLHPLVIMASVPFAFIGVVTALVVTGTTFNMNSFLGVIVLVGIVVNNAIVLVDAVNTLRRDHGRALADALVEAARRRLRPILMTTLTTVLAMVPLALGVGEGSEVQAPLARVVVGGLSTSALVTLVVVPCLYLLVERRGLVRREEAAKTAPSRARPDRPA